MVEVVASLTSNTLGKASNVFTQLAMYWQLHLAYDKGYNYKTYADYKEQLANLFFARVDTYARTPAKAPAPNKVALTISGGSDQALMRLACAAAEKNLCTPACGAVLDSDMVSCRIHKCARKHSLVTDIQMSLRNLVNRIRSVCI